MNEDRLLTRAEVESITTLSRSSLYRKMRSGTFPEPIRIGDRGRSLASLRNPRLDRVSPTCDW